MQERKHSISDSFLFFLFLGALALFCYQSLQSMQSLSSQADSLAENPKVILIDPGHGGEDGGTQASDGTMEKDINLQIALYLRRYLQAAGFRVVMTREADVDLGDDSLKTLRERKADDIYRRFAMIEENAPCLFISIHQNHFSDSRYGGAQVFYSPNHADSEALAQCIQKAFIEHLQPENTRQCKEADSSIYLLTHAEVPAVLVECGFLSNEEDLSNLKNPVYQQKAAACIMSGLVDFLRKNGVVIPSVSWYDETIMQTGETEELWQERIKPCMYVPSAGFPQQNGTGNAPDAASGTLWKKNWLLLRPLFLPESHLLTG